MDRTEEEKIIQSPASVKLGGKDYQIPPLPIKYSLPWVKKVSKILMGVVSLEGVTSDNEEAFADAFGEIMVSRPEQLIDLFFEYARDLDKEAISGVASSAEIVNAFEAVLSFERPLFGMVLRAFRAATPETDLAKILSTLSPSGTSPQSK